MKLILLSLFLMSFCTQEIPENEISLDNGRVLDESIVLLDTQSYSSETEEMKSFYLKINEEHEKNSESIIITSSLNSDSSQTTGNEDPVEDIQRLLPNYDEPVQELDNTEKAIAHHNFLSTMFNILNPDFFKEDPKMFLGDYDAYFKIVKKRSILFFYVSRIFLYATIFFLIYQFIDKKEDQKENVQKQVFKRANFNCLVILQSCIFGLILVSAGVVFYKIGSPKAIIDDSGSDLIYEFRKMNNTSYNIDEQINKINDEKYKIPIDKFGIFSITNLIGDDLAEIEQDVNMAMDFSHNMLKNPNLTNYSLSLIIIFNGILLLGISILSYYQKNPWYQKILFYLCGLSISFTIYTTGVYMANYSALHDICTSVIQINSRSSMPERGIGLIKFVGCSKENTFFQQLYVNLQAQNAAKKLFNNEMFKIHRDPIHSPDEATRTAEFLKQIDSSSVNISAYADILNRNKSIIYDLLTINKCNMIKNWLSETEGGLCLEGSEKLLNIFWIFIVIIVGFIMLMVTAFWGEKILDRYVNLNIIKTHTFRKKRLIYF